MSSISIHAMTGKATAGAYLHNHPHCQPGSCWINIYLSELGDAESGNPVEVTIHARSVQYLLDLAEVIRNASLGLLPIEEPTVTVDGATQPWPADLPTADRCADGSPVPF